MIYLLIGWALAVLGGFIVGLCFGFRLAEKTRPADDVSVPVAPRRDAGFNPNPPPAGSPPVSQTRPKVIQHGARRTP